MSKFHFISAKNTIPRHQSSYCQRMIGVSWGVQSPSKRTVFWFHYHSQKVIGSLGNWKLVVKYFAREYLWINSKFCGAHKKIFLEHPRTPKYKEFPATSICCSGLCYVTPKMIFLPLPLKCEDLSHKMSQVPENILRVQSYASWTTMEVVNLRPIATSLSFFLDTVHIIENFPKLKKVRFLSHSLLLCWGSKSCKFRTAIMWAVSGCFSTFLSTKLPLQTLVRQAWGDVVNLGPQ